MNKEKLIKYWKSEEEVAHIHGWDFSYIGDRFEEDSNLPWDLKDVILSYKKDNDEILDMDTGGGEFLLSLGLAYDKTSVTEGHPPNVELCREKLEPMGMRVYEMTEYSQMPFKEESFDLIINRHGAYDAKEIYRVLKPGGVFITQQVGEDNDRELVELLLPGLPKSFPDMNMETQKKVFEKAGFTILKSDEAFRRIRFFEVGALVWFAKVIEWEFVDFSVEKCMEQLLLAQQEVEKNGYVQGTTHRYLLVVQKC